MKLIFNLKDDEQIMLRGDYFNYELCKIVRNTDPASGEVNENYVPFKFFQSLPQALTKLLEFKVRASDATDLKQLAADLETARAEINEAWSTTIKGGKK